MNTQTHAAYAVESWDIIADRARAHWDTHAGGIDPTCAKCSEWREAVRLAGHHAEAAQRQEARAEAFRKAIR